jgi:hypothetical protein
MSASIAPTTPTTAASQQAVLDIFQKRLVQQAVDGFIEYVLPHGDRGAQLIVELDTSVPISTIEMGDDVTHLLTRVRVKVWNLKHGKPYAEITAADLTVFAEALPVNDSRITTGDPLTQVTWRTPFANIYALQQAVDYFDTEPMFSNDPDFITVR